MAVLELKKDNLNDYMHYEDLIVVFSSTTCKACTRLKPYLYELDPKYEVIILDATRLVKSNRLIPGGIQFYPTIGFFHNGYFIKELTQIDIINKTIE
jgi:thiol-disulfide isomerase/thioredoxin